ncbi:hydrogenase 4, membrane subunit HyfF [Escherichia coli]|nr:hydrogenase 4, membrane subunit HyfF [Escherichia coli]
MESSLFVLFGVAFGLFGTVLVYANAASVMPQAEMAIFWSEVLKQSSLLEPTLCCWPLCLC